MGLFTLFLRIVRSLNASTTHCCYPQLSFTLSRDLAPLVAVEGHAEGRRRMAVWRVPPSAWAVSRSDGSASPSPVPARRRGPPEDTGAARAKVQRVDPDEPPVRAGGRGPGSRDEDRQPGSEV